MADLKLNAGDRVHAGLYDYGGMEHNVRHYLIGAKGDGANNDTPAFLAAEANATFKTISLNAGTYRFDASATLTKTLHFAADAILRPQTGAALDLTAATIDAPPRKIFDLSRGGTIIVKGRVLPEWFGAVGDDGVTDDNEGWRWLAQSITHGTTIVTREGATYSISNVVKMDTVENRTIKIDGINDLALVGGGTIKRAASASAASVVLWIGNGEGIRIDVSLDGNRDNVPNGVVLDTLVLYRCTHVTLSNVYSRDSLRHGVNATECKFVTSGPAQSHRPIRYGMSYDRLHKANLGPTTATTSTTRTAQELTNGCRDVQAGAIVALGCLDGVMLGEHQAYNESNERIVYPSIFVNGTDPALDLLGAEVPTTAQILTNRGLVIQGGSYTDPVTSVVTPNNHSDITIGTLDVYYVKQFGISANQVYRLGVGQTRLVNNGDADRRGAYIIDSGEVMFLNGWVRGWATPMEFLRCEHVILRNLVFDGSKNPLLFRDCPRVSIVNCVFKNGTSSDYLISILNAEGFAMERLEVVGCTGINNVKTTLRLNNGATGTLADLTVRDNRGITYDPYQPSGYDPVTVGGYYMDDETFRTLTVNSATPRVDRSANWQCVNTATTTITNFLGGREGMRRVVFFNDSFTSLAHNASTGIDLQGNAMYTPGQGKYSEFIYRSGRWIEISRMTT